MPTRGDRPDLLVDTSVGSHFSAVASEELLADLAAAGIAGGSAYDALVGAAAKEHGVVLATRDRRALDTYRALHVEVEVVPDE